MQGWGAPLATAAFWAGLLVWDARPPEVTSWPWWAWLVLGGVAFAASWATAPGRRRIDPLQVAGLAAAEHPSIAAVARPGA